MSEYQPLKTNAERRRERAASAVEAMMDHVVGRFLPEVEKEFGRKLAQGADEFANMLFSGSAYLPWPGPGPAPVEQPQPGEIAPAAPQAPIIGEASPDLDAYAFGYQREAPDHRSLYGIGADIGPQSSGETHLGPQQGGEVLISPPPRVIDHNSLYFSSEAGGIDHRENQLPHSHLEGFARRGIKEQDQDMVR